MSAQTPGDTPGDMPDQAQGVSRLAFTTNAASLETTTRRTSAPGTPQPTIEVNKHAPSSPSLQRRSSAQYSRPGSSASPRLMRKSSRSSLGSSSSAPPEEGRRPTPKRSISNLITELRGAQATMEAIPEPVVMTAPEIAAECFKRELEAHEEAPAGAIVLLHDACYGHRFARPKSSKGTLSMIVERPERLLASALGVATSYVRLGGYHTGERNALHPKHVPGTPPFKIRRSSRALDIKSTYVTNVHGFEWMTELGTMCSNAASKLAAGEKEVARLDSVAGQERRMLHEGDLYLCHESLAAFEGALGGVADAVDAVFSAATETSRAFVAVRPPGHHCSADYPSGFCWINNVHVGIEYAAQTYDLTHAAIIDFDLHHGDGSQAITWERNSRNHNKRLYPKSFTKTRMAPDIGYYSLHDINSYPCEMGDDEKVQAASLCIHNAHNQSIWNVHLEPWKTVEEFWTLYESKYLVLLEKARDFLQHQTTRINLEGKQKPKAAIFISAGFDASEWEGEGMQRHKVNVPTSFYARFTEDIMKIAQESGTSCDGRVISVLEGGYSDRALCSSTISHLTALCSTKSAEPPIHLNSLGISMQPQRLDSQMQGLSLHSTYDPSWWSKTNLEALELHVNPIPAALAGGKKVRAGLQPTYATPTESFAYKVIDPAKFARSVSGTLREGAVQTRPSTPPPPEVDWIVAAHELSKLLVPTERSTRSYTAEELAGPKKKDRTSGVGLTPSPDELDKPRQRRTRGKIQAPMTPAQPSKRVLSGGDRRKTMADFVSAVAEAGPVTIQPRRPSRRSSMASTASTISTMPDASVPPIPTAPAAIARPIPRPLAALESSVQVKKTRPAPIASVTKPKKVTSITSGAYSGAGSSATAIPPPANGDASNVQSQDAGVDALASGFKRITLKVGSREENERRAKEKLDAERRARALKGAETRRINKAAKEAKAAEEKRMANVVATQPSMQQGQIGGFQHPTHSAQHVDLTKPLPQAVQMMSYQPPGPTANTHYSDSSLGLAEQPAVQAYPQLGGIVDPPYSQQVRYSTGFQQDSTLAQAPSDYWSALATTQASQASIPDQSTSVAASYTPYTYPTGGPTQSLPVFTSTSHIPFATAPGRLSNMPPPTHAYGFENGLHHPTEHNAPHLDSVLRSEEMPQHDGMPLEQQYETYGEPERASLHAYDVWAIPDTPSKQNFR